MTQLTFTLDGETHETAVTPPTGDPNALFTAGQAAVVAAVEAAGYRFTPGAAPAYQDLTRAYRETPAGIDLGDFTDRVTPQEPEPPADPEPDPDPPGPEPPAASKHDLTLVGPDGTRETRAFTPHQNLGAVGAAIGLAAGIRRDERVVLYPTGDRRTRDELAPHIRVEDLDGHTLYWEVSSQ